MILLYSLIAIFIAWIWVDYYRLIDIYEKEKLWQFAVTFLLGCASPFLVVQAGDFILDRFSFELGDGALNNFLYCVLKIGLIEETAKLIPFLVALAAFKKHINEPIDYLAFICVSALGFSAAENAIYFNNHGSHLIDGRAVLATVGHMFDSSLIAYGIIRQKYYYKARKPFVLLLFFFLAALSHGFYDFWLIYEGAAPWGPLVTMLYFLITLSLFSVILNNALNNSTFFTYKKVVNPNKVAGRLLTYYGIVFLIQFGLISITESFRYALLNLTANVYISGAIAIICCLRLSRFKLIKERWDKLKIEFPFTLAYTDALLTRKSSYRIVIKGDSYNETYINAYYEEYFYLHPLSRTDTYLGSEQLAFIERKIFLKNDETFYLVKIFNNARPHEFEQMLLKPKTWDTTMVRDLYPIVGLLRIDHPDDIENLALTSRDFGFIEWAYITPRETV